MNTSETLPDLSPESSAGAQKPIVNIAAYQFVKLHELAALRTQLYQAGKLQKLKGTILISPEGINLFLAGLRAGVEQFMATLKADQRFTDMKVKESLSETQPFRRFLVKIKAEIIAFGVDSIDPTQATSPKLTPAELKQWLDEGRSVTLLDTRNDYEVRLGSFENAIDLNIQHFRTFPEAIEQLPTEMKQAPVVMFCTGGIRCEKAGPFMEQAGFEQVYQLDGGILQYFEDCGSAHWNGDCFVFDGRVAVNPELQETPATVCYQCQQPVSAEDQRSPRYVPGESCPYCYRPPEEIQRELLAKRATQIKTVCTPLPGSTPQTNVRPIHIPSRLAGISLIEFLVQVFPQIPLDDWQRKIACGEIRLDDQPVQANRIVQDGEHYENREHNVIEPDINSEIQILYEDDAIVVINKPAPLPVHASGRFHRNTLIEILNSVYQPQRLRPAHRLDANTSGVLVCCRKRSVARVVQPLFEQQQVQKVYLARVHGHPEPDEFVCESPISREPMHNGLRLPCKQGLAAVTRCRVLTRDADGTAVLLITPQTGRTNQIRAHLWGQNLAICCDPAYLRQQGLGENRTLTVNEQPMCLHAWRLIFPHPLTKQATTFTADLPVWLKSLPTEVLSLV